MFTSDGRQYRTLGDMFTLDAIRPNFTETPVLSVEVDGTQVYPDYGGTEGHQEIIADFVYSEPWETRSGTYVSERCVFTVELAPIYRFAIAVAPGLISTPVIRGYFSHGHIQHETFRDKLIYDYDTGRYYCIGSTDNILTWEHYLKAQDGTMVRRDEIYRGFAMPATPVNGMLAYTFGVTPGVFGKFDPDGYWDEDIPYIVSVSGNCPVFMDGDDMDDGHSVSAEDYVCGVTSTQ